MKTKTPSASPGNEDVAPDALTWDYECQTCTAFFTILVPKGPRAERAVRCPQCGGQDIRRVNACKLSEATACG